MPEKESKLNLQIGPAYAGLFFLVGILPEMAK
jgi:hypothetical protein